MRNLISLSLIIFYCLQSNAALSWDDGSSRTIDTIIFQVGIEASSHTESGQKLLGIKPGPGGSGVTLDYGSLGQGYEFNVYIGGQYHKHISNYLSAGYFRSNQLEGVYFLGEEGIMHSEILHETGGRIGTVDANMYQTTTGLKLHFPFDDLVEVYADVGLLIGLPKVEQTMEITREANDPDGDNDYELAQYVEWEFKRDIGIGFKTGMGMILNMMDNFRLNFAITFNKFSYAPTRLEITHIEDYVRDEPEQTSFKIRKSLPDPSEDELTGISNPISFDSLSMRFGLMYIFGL